MKRNIQWNEGVPNGGCIEYSVAQEGKVPLRRVRLEDETTVLQGWYPVSTETLFDVHMTYADGGSYPYQIVVAAKVTKKQAARIVGALLVSPVYKGALLEEASVDGEWINETRDS